MFEAIFGPPRSSRPFGMACAAALVSVFGLSCAPAAKDGTAALGALCTAGCATGSCVAGRCRADNALPAPAWSKRLLLEPSDIALLTPGESTEDHPAALVPAAMAGAQSVLLFRFASTWNDSADISSAFLLLKPGAGASPRHASSRVQIARILEPWDAGTATWGRQPRLSLPEDAGFLMAAPITSARIDVTPLVRAWAKRRPGDHGIALLVDGALADGMRYSMGVTDGPGPKLEVYIK